MTEDQVFNIARAMGLRPCRDRTDGGVTIQPIQEDGGYYNLRFSPEDNLGDANMTINFLLGRLSVMRSAMQEFLDRVDRGEVRSRRTYEKFKSVLYHNGVL